MGSEDVPEPPARAEQLASSEDLPGSRNAGPQEGEDGHETGQKEGFEEAPAIAADSIVVEEAVPDSGQGTTAFFLFSNIHRARVKAHLEQSIGEGNKVTIGMIGKAIGSLWGGCSDAVKKAYAEAAKRNKAAAPPVITSDTDHAIVGFPRSVVKRVIMQDKDQGRIAAASVDVTAKAAVMFLETVAGKAHLEAAGSARSTLNFRDVEAVLGRWKATGWGGSPFREIENREPARDTSGAGKALQEAAKNTRDIASFFARPPPSQAAGAS